LLERPGLGPLQQGPWYAALPQKRPWTEEQLAQLLVLHIVSLVGILASWYGAAHVGSMSGRMLWLNLAIGGLVVAALGDAMWLLRLRRSVTARRVSLLIIAPHGEPSRSEGRLVVVKGMTRYHRETCPLVMRKAVTVSSRSTHERARRVPCEACQP